MSIKQHPKALIPLTYNPPRRISSKTGHRTRSAMVLYEHTHRIGGPVCGLQYLAWRVAAVDSLCGFEYSPCSRTYCTLHAWRKGATGQSQRRQICPYAPRDALPGAVL
jgi:hypothetical protein